MLSTPTGIKGVINTFGDINLFVRNDGTLDPKWEEMNIVRIDLPAPLGLSGTTSKVSKITCHKFVAANLKAALDEIHAEGLWSEIDPYGGGFNFRPKRGSGSFSLHSWGIAWDFRPDQNKLGTVGTMSPKVVAIFEKHGFMWGGNFKGRKDPMHFQFAKGV